jgi:hypothetical protein
MAKRLPEHVLDYFREQGAKGGRIGGRIAAANATPAERRARALKASKAAAAARTKKAQTKKST